MKDMWAGNAEEAQRDFTGRHLVCEPAVQAVRWLYVLSVALKVVDNLKVDFHLYADWGSKLSFFSLVCFK